MRWAHIMLTGEMRNLRGAHIMLTGEMRNMRGWMQIILLEKHRGRA